MAIYVPVRRWCSACLYARSIRPESPLKEAADVVLRAKNENEFRYDWNVVEVTNSVLIGALVLLQRSGRIYMEARLIVDY